MNPYIELLAQRGPSINYTPRPAAQTQQASTQSSGGGGNIGWANMTEEQRLAHSIKHGTDYQNKVTDPGLWERAQEYLSYDSQPGVAQDVFANSNPMDVINNADQYMGTEQGREHLQAAYIAAFSSQAASGNTDWMTDDNVKWRQYKELFGEDSLTEGQIDGINSSQSTTNKDELGFGQAQAGYRPGGPAYSGPGGYPGYNRGAPTGGSGGGYGGGNTGGAGGGNGSQGGSGGLSGEPLPSRTSGFGMGYRASRPTPMADAYIRAANRANATGPVSGLFKDELNK